MSGETETDRDADEERAGDSEGALGLEWPVVSGTGVV